MARSVTATKRAPSTKKTETEPVNSKANGSAGTNSAIEDDATYRDFFWTYTEEPHRTRRLAIIKAHPEVS
jgi:sphingolipid delta-4 desaturase